MAPFLKSPLFLVFLVLSVYGLVTAGTGEQVVLLGAMPAKTHTNSSSSQCAVSKTIRAEPARDPNASPFGYQDWYVNADRSIWVAKQPWQAGAGGNKVIWIRPAGTQLVISGKRLDAASSPLRADAPCCYPTGFQVTGLYFPTPGCWEITAKAGNKELKFVTEVIEPSPSASVAPSK